MGQVLLDLLTAPKYFCITVDWRNHHLLSDGIDIYPILKSIKQSTIDDFPHWRYDDSTPINIPFL
jgi:hypothetical protein